MDEMQLQLSTGVNVANTTLSERSRPYTCVYQTRGMLGDMQAKIRPGNDCPEWEDLCQVALLRQPSSASSCLQCVPDPGSKFLPFMGIPVMWD